jgi:hypothetical protein
MFDAIALDDYEGRWLCMMGRLVKSFFANKTEEMLYHGTFSSCSGFAYQKYGWMPTLIVSRQSYSHGMLSP